jgi:predicted anti-sigma-YlaC factor YlaD
VGQVHGHCERAREWVSADVDGELSTFERILLAGHLQRCAACRAFSSDIRGLTTALRAAPREQFHVTLAGRFRRHARMRLAPAAAAMAIAAVGLGSLLASSQLNRAPGLQPTEAVPVARATSDFPLNGGRSQRLKEQRLSRVIGLPGRPGPALP